MFSRLQWLLVRLSRQMWLRATAFSVLGILTALAGLVFKRYIPADLPTKIGAEAVDSILNILAASMLSVTIFSLSTMVAAYASATSNVTPRATRLLAGDSTAQNALATFIGSFLFSLVGIIVLKTGLYGATGRVVLYVVTLLVVVLVVVMLLRWIDYVLRLGRVGPTSDRVEQVAVKAMQLRQKSPSLGGRPRSSHFDDLPAEALPLFAPICGYVEHIDMSRLQDQAETHDLQVHIASLPGDFSGAARPLAYLLGAVPDEVMEEMRGAFSIGEERSFDQDPRFGACVLSEIASRALSPGINDPGTAIEILGRGARVIALWSQRHPDAVDANGVCYERIHAPSIEVGDLFDDFFTPIARDGAGILEVGIHLQKMLQMLASLGDERYRQAALHHSQQAMERAEIALDIDDDKQRLRHAAERVAIAAAS